MREARILMCNVLTYCNFSLVLLLDAIPMRMGLCDVRCIIYEGSRKYKKKGANAFGVVGDMAINHVSDVENDAKACHITGHGKEFHDDIVHDSIFCVTDRDHVPFYLKS